MKKVLVALKDDLTKEIERANSEMGKPLKSHRSSHDSPKGQGSRMSRSKLTAPVHLGDELHSREESPEQAHSKSRIESRQSSRLSRARSKQKLAKKDGDYISSQQCDLHAVDLDVEEPILDIAVVNETNIFGCGEFGLKEYILNEKGGIEEEYFLLENQVILDVHQDFNGRVVFTNPDEGSVYLVNGEDIVFVTQFQIRNFNSIFFLTFLK